MDIHEWLIANEPPIDEDATQRDYDLPMPLWEADEAARRLGVSVELFRLIASLAVKAGEMTSIVFGSKLLYREREVMGLINHPLFSLILIRAAQRKQAGEHDHEL